MKRRRLIKLEKQYFSTDDPFNSRALCTSEIVKSANQLAIDNDVIILEIKEPSWSIGKVHIYTKATRANYDKFCKELIKEFAPYLAGYSI